MSEEFESAPEPTYSSFWPMLILVVGFLVWFALQDYLLNKQRVSYNHQFQDQQFLNVVSQADNVSSRYVALMKDLVETAGKEGKDSPAAKIVTDAIAGGLIHVQPNATNSASSTPPADSSK